MGGNVGCCGCGDCVYMLDCWGELWHEAPRNNQLTHRLGFGTSCLRVVSEAAPNASTCSTVWSIMSHMHLRPAVTITRNLPSGARRSSSADAQTSMLH